MEVILKISSNTIGVRLLRSFVFLCLIINSQIVLAQTDSTITDSAATAVTDDSSGPSIANLSKNLASSAAELEKIRHEEIMSYIYMGVGFSIVIAIAWFTTVLARKRRRKEDEIRAIRAQNMKHKAHHHGHHGHRR